MKLSKYLCAAALIVSVAGCHSSAKAGGAGSSSTGASTSSAPTPSLSLPSQNGPLTRVAELSYAGGFKVGNELAVPAVAVYSDGSVIFGAEKRLTLTPGALAMLVTSLQPDLRGQPTTVLLPKNGHAIPDGANTGVGVLEPGGKYQMVYALGLSKGSESQYPAPVADAFDKLEALTSDATTPYTTTKVRYALKCAPAGNGPEKPWPAGVPQAGVGQSTNCLELHVVDGATATAVRAACASTNTPVTPGQPQPAVVVYRSDHGPRTCRWRYALPDEAS